MDNPLSPGRQSTPAYMMHARPGHRQVTLPITPPCKFWRKQIVSSIMAFRLAWRNQKCLDTSQPLPEDVLVAALI